MTEANQKAIAAAQRLYISCNDRINEIVKDNGRKPTAQVFDKLKSQNMICTNEIRVIEELLSQGAEKLDLPSIEKSRKAFEQCRAGSIIVLNKKKALVIV